MSDSAEHDILIERIETWGNKHYDWAIAIGKASICEDEATRFMARAGELFIAGHDDSARVMRELAHEFKLRGIQYRATQTACNPLVDEAWEDILFQLRRIEGLI